MGVDEHLLLRKGIGTGLSGNASDDLGSPASSPARNVDSIYEKLRADMRKLTSSINDLTAVFNRAHDDIQSEPALELSKKMDKLIEQNEEIGRALLLLLELHREHIPKIAQNTRLSHSARLRRPAMSIFGRK